MKLGPPPRLCAPARRAPLATWWLTTALLCLHLVVVAAPDVEPALFTGNWTLNTKLSDDVEDRLDGKLRKVGIMKPNFPVESNARKTRTSHGQENYWNTISESRQRRAAKNLTRLGVAYPLMTADRFEISLVDDGLRIVYDGELPRELRPNRRGRVFSASGEELVVDTFGHTLAYWHDRALTLELDPPGGGKIVEKFALDGQPPRLHHSLMLDLPVLNESVTIERVFEAETQPHP